MSDGLKGFTGEAALNGKGNQNHEQEAQGDKGTAPAVPGRRQSEGRDGFRLLDTDDIPLLQV